MASEAYLILLLLLGAVLISPVLAVIALVRVGRLRMGSDPDPKLIQRIYALERQTDALVDRMRQLERGLGLDLPAPATPPRTAPEPAVPPSPPQAAPGRPAATHAPSFFPTQPDREDSKVETLESVVAGRWLNRAGILALLFAVSFFLKYAFDNNWVGPRGRVAIGLLLGTSMLPWSAWLLNRGYRYFSEGIAGLGAATLYLSIWAGWHYYQLFPQGTSFAGMIVVTAAMVAVAVGRDSQRIALLALIGGALTPVLLSTGRDQQIMLFAYLAVLDAGILALSWLRDWQVLAPISFVMTQIYYWGWHATFYRTDKLLSTSLFATLFFLLFAALPMTGSRQEGKLREAEIAVVVGNALAYLAMLQALFWPEHRWTLTAAVLALAAAHLLAARSVPVRTDGAGQSAARVLYAGFALMFVTLAIPIRLDGKWITMAWAVEGAILIWTGLRERMLLLRATGLLLFAVVGVRLLMFPIPADAFLLNARFAAYAVAVGSLGWASYLAERGSVSLGNEEKGVFRVLGIAVNVYALIALSLEFWDLFGRAATLQMDQGLAQQLALSVFWTVYATGLIAAGLARKSAALRWQALLLFGLVVGKVFLFDLSFLERFYRILSFFIVGLVSLIVSFLYQRKVQAER